MQSLEILYETILKNNTFFDRKQTITQKKTIVYGPRKSGKTHLIIDHLRHYEKGSYLYLDFSDDRLEIDSLEENLSLFVKKYPIKLLVIEHFDFSFPLPKTDEIILSTIFTCKELEGFSKLTLYPLDFEEFISFDKKHSNIEHIFNLFANHGTFPQIVQYTESDYHRTMQDMLHVMLKDETAFLIYKRFCELQSTKVTLFQIYNQLKSTMKISKDKLYAITSNLIEQKLLFLVEKHGQPSAAKKVFQIDFALKNALTFKKDFLKRFENMVFLELMKRDKTIFYDDLIDLYIPNEHLAVFCIPFATDEVVQSKMKKLTHTLKSLHVNKVEIITLGNEESFVLDTIQFSMLPFWDWALQL